MAETPQGCQEHQPDYKSQSWEAYSLFELGTWVHLFAKRAEHRSDIAKRKKDLHDAQNYLDRMQSRLRELRYENSDLMLEVKRLAPDAYKVGQVYAFVVDDVLKDDKLGYVVPMNNFDWYDGNVILPLEQFITSMRVHHPNLFVANLKLTLEDWMEVYKEDRAKLGLPDVPEHGGHLKQNKTTAFDRKLKIREAEARIRKIDAETALTLANAEKAETVALHKVANEKHERNVAQQRRAAGLDPRLPESDYPFASCPKMTQSERDN